MAHTRPTQEKVLLGPSGSTLADVVDVARHGVQVELTAESLEAVAEVRRHVEDLAAGEVPTYGISTGFGALADKHIPIESRAQLQKSLIRSHAAGMGPAVEKEVVRALMFLRATTLASGRTGVRPEVVQTMVAMLNADILPVVHEYGSLGCSGDLAPLSHVALALMGEGPATGPDGTEAEAGELMRAAGIEPLELREKEGLALINGTEGMLGMLILALHDLDALADALDLTAAMSVEALLGTDRVFVPELHHPLRPHAGQAASADRMLRILAGSPIVASHREGDSRVQDAYSLRCAPQVAGGLRDTLGYVRSVAERELAATIDNPVVLPDGRVSSNGNFHGAPVAYVLDFLAIPVADAASISERRTDRMLDPARSHGLPAFLVDDPGVDSGMMIAQYTQAALVSDMKRLAVPASVDSIPSSAMQEDHVSMGWHAARKLRTAVENFRRVLAVELVAAGRAIELRAPLEPARATGAALQVIRAAGVPGPGPDRFMAPQLAAAEQVLRDGSVLEAVAEVLEAAGEPSDTEVEDLSGTAAGRDRGPDAEGH